MNESMVMGDLMGHTRHLCREIINTSYQKLPFGSGDYPDKLLFHQALNQVSNYMFRFKTV